MLPITLKQLESFLAVAEEKNFLRAAKRLRRSQSAISSQIQMLERQLGVPLFHRTTRSVRMTSAGTRLLGDARGVLNRLDNVVTDLRAEEALQQGRLTVACTPSCASNLLPDLLKDYQSRYPNITLDVKEAYAVGMYELLRREEADIAIGPIDRDDGDFACRKLQDDPYRVIMSRDYHLAGRDQIAFRDITDEPHLVLQRESAIYESMVQLFAGQGRDWRPKFELSHHQSLYGLVAAGLGVTVMPTSALPPDAAERFHTALLIEPEQSRELGLIYVKGNTLSPAVEAFASCAADRQAEL